MNRPEPASETPAQAHMQVRLADAADLRWAQQQVTAHHYLHAPVDPRCSPLAYVVTMQDVAPFRVGCLIFGRPEATRVNGWYGSVEDVQAGRCPLTRWQVLNLARVWLDPLIQRGGPYYIKHAASWVIGQALQRVGYEYLVAHPPCFLDEPYEIRTVLSYCDTAQHSGCIYRKSGFQKRHKNGRGLRTYAIPVRPLTLDEHAHIARLAQQSSRSRRYRAGRIAAQQVVQLEMEQL